MIVRPPRKRDWIIPCLSDIIKPVTHLLINSKVLEEAGFTKIKNRYKGKDWRIEMKCKDCEANARDWNYLASELGCEPTREDMCKEIRRLKAMEEYVTSLTTNKSKETTNAESNPHS